MVWGVIKYVIFLGIFFGIVIIIRVLEGVLEIVSVNGKGYYLLD